MEKVVKCKRCCKCFFGDKCPFCGYDKNFELTDMFEAMFGDDAIKDFLGSLTKPNKVNKGENNEV